MDFQHEVCSSKSYNINFDIFLGTRSRGVPGKKIISYLGQTESIDLTFIACWSNNMPGFFNQFLRRKNGFNTAQLILFFPSVYWKKNLHNYRLRGQLNFFNTYLS